jgi:hypothetical protein
VRVCFVVRLPAARLFVVPAIVRFSPFLSVHAADVTYKYFSASDCSGTPIFTELKYQVELGVCVGRHQLFVAADGSAVYYIGYDDVDCALPWSDVLYEKAGPTSCVGLLSEAGMSYLQVDVPAEGERGPPLPELLQTWPPEDSYEVRQCTDAVCQENCRTRKVVHLGRCAGLSDSRCSGEGQVLLQNSYANANCDTLLKIEGRLARADLPTCDDGYEYVVCPTTVTAATGPPADIQQMRVGYGYYPASSTTCALDTLWKFALFRNATCINSRRYTGLPDGVVLEESSFADNENCTGGTPTQVTHVGACEAEEYATKYISALSPEAAQYPFACEFGWGPCGSESSSTGESGDDSSSSSSATGNSTDASSSSSSSSSSGGGDDDGNNNAASASVAVSTLALFVSLLMALMVRA